jgi:hypothetical protein
MFPALEVMDRSTRSWLFRNIKVWIALIQLHINIINQQGLLSHKSPNHQSIQRSIYFGSTTSKMRGLLILAGYITASLFVSALAVPTEFVAPCIFL